MSSPTLALPQETNPAAGRLARWVRFLDQREPGTTLALFRIAIGLVIVGAIGSVVVHGLVPSVWMSREHGGFLGQVQENWLFRLLGGATPANVWLMTYITLASGALLALGLGGRITPFVALQAYMALTNLNGVSNGGDDTLMANALWLLVLSRSTATLSLDCRLRERQWTSEVQVPAWPRFVVIFQLVLVYWATGVQKISAEWVPGGEMGALYYIMQQPAWMRWDMTWLAWVFPLTQLATLISWLFEVLAPLLLLAFYFRMTADRPGRIRAFFNWLNYRRLFVVVGVTMHASLIILMNVEPFSWVTLSFYLCLFRPEEWHALGKRLVSGKHPAGAVQGVHVPIRASRMPAWWSRTRAFLVTLHLLAITVGAIPVPPDSVLDRETWDIPSVHLNLVAWSERLNRLGIEATPADLGNFAMNVSGGWIRAYNAATAPFEPYYKYCGTYQSWCMFAAADPEPGRLHVEVEEGGTWRTVAVGGDPNYPWLAGWLGHHRIRPALSYYVEERHGFDHFTAWLAEQAAHDFPHAQRVRVRFFRQPTPSPEAVRAGLWPPGRFEQSQVVSIPIKNETALK